MATTTNTFPYEFLCRWDEKSGKLKAYHFKTITVVMDGDKVIAAGESDAMTPKQADAVGFKYADILDRLHMDALTAVDDEKAASAKALSDATTAHAKETADLQAAHAKETAELQTALTDALAKIPEPVE